ncbi:SCO family protein [Polaromonas sp.]|uniref:SCO family protein n=1 Tax=Polaromonas sp. TaxID=1869339 RepID=UPI0017B4C6C5|nr:SCO family protein [Polaromonas sp.]NMM05960.1 SCO family protein [Polaromonas sp.]
MKYRFLVGLMLSGMLLLLAGGQAQAQASSSVKNLGTFGNDFHLTDPEGKERSFGEFRGKAVMLFFGFTQCPAVCPTTLATAAGVRKLLGKDAERLQVIFVTIDPERDSAAVLKNYAAAFDPTILGLRTDMAHTKKVAKAFNIFYEKVPTGGSYTMDHTAFSFIFDGKGDFRQAVHHGQSAEQVAADVRQLL